MVEKALYSEDNIFFSDGPISLKEFSPVDVRSRSKLWRLVSKMASFISVGVIGARSESESVWEIKGVRKLKSIVLVVRTLELNLFFEGIGE